MLLACTANLGPRLDGDSLPAEIEHGIPMPSSLSVAWIDNLIAAGRSTFAAPAAQHALGLPARPYGRRVHSQSAGWLASRPHTGGPTAYGLSNPASATRARSKVSTVEHPASWARDPMR